MRILGIDPGSRVTGYGVVEQRAGQVAHVAHGTLRPRGDSFAVRLSHLHESLCEVIALHRPDVAALEQIFVSGSARSALVLGEARGVLLSALGSAGLVVHEYTASQVKQAVTGSGRAAKPQVKAMVRRLLALERVPAADAADALAVAIRHAHGGRLESAGVVAGRRPRQPSGLRVRARPGR
ncbi:MAG: crossover junction endodeoxyribonuclease RuvC [Deltaproteobacteria bacterium]|nr:crossover junction endodeoxyribonuclease RuvC [Deltaproteobacteria bacterium]MBW2361072.1 crossover junction endodeoxyribonuclease RuvC [Deltaproteobacteria bacterium]